MTAVSSIAGESQVEAHTADAQITELGQEARSPASRLAAAFREHDLSIRGAGRQWAQDNMPPPSIAWWTTPLSAYEIV